MGASYVEDLPRIKNAVCLISAGLMSIDALHAALPGPPGSSSAGPACSTSLPTITLPSPLPSTFESEDFFFSIDVSAVKETVGCRSYQICIAVAPYSLPFRFLYPCYSVCLPFIDCSRFLDAGLGNACALVFVADLRRRASSKFYKEFIVWS